MFKRIMLVTVLVLSVAGTVYADNVSGLGAGEEAEGSISKALTAGNLNFMALYKCSDPSFTSFSMSARTADCCIAGDAWRVALVKGKKIATSSNFAGTGSGSAVLAPDVFGAFATVGSAQGVSVVVTTGNAFPGGFAAGGTVNITTPAGGPVCALKKCINGSLGVCAAP